ncbi:lytic transglycosylase [Pedobacter sp. HMWF019]|uniref:lytic transglycosylase domain-containing protein n=1 Tax=Pedobacter sp. HMWF019 TaxID=2056856 RepID=UPI000D386560|nr:lytic transglycosylase domain-containing protein [Pedobacter sp. HMWF019]PTS98446.1 lytic transglycosylase [Pedobacter sp. HMWF019]
MKKNVLLLSFCIVVSIHFGVKAQQINPASSDTSSVPVLVEETPTFNNYNFVYKQRLDSIQKMVPLKYNEFVQKYIDIYSSRKDMIGKMLGLSSYYFPIFEQALRAYNVPEEIKYLPIIESAMNPHAVSRVGATGLWQFMFSTAKGYGLNMDNFVDERKDPVQASNAAAAYFRDAYAELGDWLLAIAAYNCGKGNVQRAIAKANSHDFWEIRPYLPLETRNYVPAFIAAMYIMNYSKAHQIERLNPSMAVKTDTVQVNNFVSLPLLAQALKIEEEDLCILNPSYKKKIVNGTEESPRRIVMPRVTGGDFAMIYEVLNNRPPEVNTRVVLASNDDRRLHKKHAAVEYHRVTRGQNLQTIADRYNVEVQDIKVWNKLRGSQIMPGQRLIVSKNSGAGNAVSASKHSRQYMSYKGDKERSQREGKI